MKTNKAFSLIELSVVVIIIGVLFAAIGSGIDLYNKSKISSARSVTRSFAGLNMPGLVYWLDASAEGSFNNLEKAPDDGEDITSWKGVKLANYEATASDSELTPNSSAANQINYVESGMGGLPAVNFSGGDYLKIDPPKMLPDEDYATSFVIVWKPNFGSTANEVGTGIFSYGAGQGAGNFMAFGKHVTYDSMALLNGYSAYCLVPHKLQFSAGDPLYTIMSIRKGSDIIIHSNQNSNPRGVCETITNSTKIGNSLFTFGHEASGYYNGQISEFMIFDRPIGDDEAEIIVEYIKKKYGF